MLLKSRPENISEIYDFWNPQNSPDRAPAAARAPFARIHKIVKKVLKSDKNNTNFDAQGSQKTLRLQESDLQKRPGKMSLQKSTKTIKI